MQDTPCASAARCEEFALNTSSSSFRASVPSPEASKAHPWGPGNMAPDKGQLCANPELATATNLGRSVT